MVLVVVASAAEVPAEAGSFQLYIRCCEQRKYSQLVTHYKMLKRDSLTAQMQQLSHTLAKVKRLILEDQEPKALEEVLYTLDHYYGTDAREIMAIPFHQFAEHICQQQYKAEELHMLAAFLDELAGLNDDWDIQKNIWMKVIIIYDLLEKEYHVLSFEHVARRNLLANALASN